MLSTADSPSGSTRRSQVAFNFFSRALRIHRRETLSATSNVGQAAAVASCIRWFPAQNP